MFNNELSNIEKAFDPKKSRMVFSRIFSPVVLVFALLAVPAAYSQTVDDKGINTAIENHLRRDEQVQADSITVSTDEGIVTLSGNADNILQKERAEKIAENIRGVRSVINRIEVRSTDRSDSEIEKQVENALMRDPATESYDVRVDVTDGKAILNGLVESWAEWNLAAEVAKSVRGVQAVKNEIDIHFVGDRSDEDIEADIRGRAQSDVLVNDNRLEIEVDDGRVDLSGKVASLAAQKRAEALAWINGVRNVDIEDLTVDSEIPSSMKGENRRGANYIPKNDNEVKQNLKKAFTYDPRLYAFEPKISVDDGVVTLTGVVGNLAAKQAAEQDALNTTGVWRIKNLLKVRPEKKRPEIEITEDIRDSFNNDPFLNESDIYVYVRNGIARLNGKVDSGFLRERAQEIAERTQGVIDVQNNILVGSDWVTKSDWEIQEDIEDELFWSPNVDSDQVNVEVEDGVATLTGTVNSWREREKAEENAYEGGAKQVKNDLYVYYGPGDFIGKPGSPTG